MAKVQRSEIEILERIEELLSVIAKAQLCDAIAENLSDKNLRKLYDLTGEKTVTELAKVFGFSAGKISGLWHKWEEAGLLIKDGNQYKKVL